MSKKSPDVIVTHKLLDLLELLYRYKYLRTSFIRLLLDCGEQGIIRQLRTRRKQGLIFKPPEQKRGYNNLYSPRIHSITKKGEDLLVAYDRHPLKATRLFRSKGDVPVKNFAHAMMICDTMASIEMGLRETGCEFIPWTAIVDRVEHPEPMKFEFSTFYKDKSVKGKLVPDGLFGIRYPDNTVSFFALEAENFNPIEPADLSRASFLKKVLAYQDIIQSKKYKQLGIPNLRVLFVFPTEARADHARELTERLYTNTNMFLFHNIPVQELLLKAPPPFPELVTSKWQRAGMDAIPLFNKES